MAKRHDRQLDIITKTDLDFNIHILGAGGIGSWTALTLAKMGCENIIVYDNDDVEDHNVASQFFKEEQLGLPKTEALKANVLEQTGVEIETEENIAEESITSGLIIIAIDSMEERIRLGELYKNKDVMIIDGRMGGLQLEIYCSHSSRYLKTTVNPEDVEPDKCTGRSINFNCLVIAGLIANYVRIYAKGNLKEGEISFCFKNTQMVKDVYAV